MAKSLVVDSDGHILEPADMWERYLEPKFKDRAIRIRVDSKGYEYVEIDGRKSPFLRGGTLASAGGAYQDPREIMTPGRVTYEEGCRRTPGAVDPHIRLKELDSRGGRAAILYPTIGIAWERDCEDPELSAAYCRAYNNWLLDYCSVNPDRLIAAAHINLRDVNLAVAELDRIKGKAKGIFVTPFPCNGLSAWDSYYDPFWGACEAAGLPVATHVQVRGDSLGSGLHHASHNPPLRRKISRAGSPSCSCRRTPLWGSTACSRATSWTAFQSSSTSCWRPAADGFRDGWTGPTANSNYSALPRG